MRVVKWLISFTILLHLSYSQESAKLRVGNPAPTFFLRSLEGENFFLSKEIKKGRSIILAFYATWCTPCLEEIPVLEIMMTDTAISDVCLYYVNVSGLLATDERGDAVKQLEGRSEVEHYKSKLKMSHPILMDPYAITARKFGATSLPALAIIGKDGKIKLDAGVELLNSLLEEKSKAVL